MKNKIKIIQTIITVITVTFAVNTAKAVEITYVSGAVGNAVENLKKIGILAGNLRAKQLFLLIFV